VNVYVDKLNLANLTGRYANIVIENMVVSGYDNGICVREYCSGWGTESATLALMDSSRTLPCGVILTRTLS